MIEMSHAVGPMTLVHDRAEYIVALAAGKSVLHLGCVDAGLTEQRVKSGKLLHSRLAATARRLVGIDIDGAGIARMRELGFTELVVGDIQAEIPLAERFEVVVAGEILEHLDAPGSFLARLQRFLAPGGILILSVPNAYSLLHLARIARNVEVVHEDHVAYYSPRTLRHLLSRHGFEVVTLAGYSETHRLGPVGTRLKSALNWALFKRRPQLAEGLVLVARPASERP